MTKSDTDSIALLTTICVIFSLRQEARLRVAYRSRPRTSFVSIHEYK
jgi:hypothetical protein